MSWAFNISEPESIYTNDRYLHCIDVTPNGMIVWFDEAKDIGWKEWNRLNPENPRQDFIEFLK